MTKDDFFLGQAVSSRFVSEVRVSISPAARSARVLSVGGVRPGQIGERRDLESKMPAGADTKPRV